MDRGRDRGQKSPLESEERILVEACSRMLTGAEDREHRWSSCPLSNRDGETMAHWSTAAGVIWELGFLQVLALRLVSLEINILRARLSHMLVWILVPTREAVPVLGCYSHAALWPN